MGIYYFAILRKIFEKNVFALRKAKITADKIVQQQKIATCTYVAIL
jgi:hypothetical protein